MRPYRRAVIAATVTAALVALQRAGLLWPDVGVLATARVGAGLALALYWPGALLAASRLAPRWLRQSDAFDAFWAAVACTIVVQSAVLIGGTAVGIEWNERLFADVQSVIAACALAAFIAAPRTPESSEAVATAKGLGLLAVTSLAIGGWAALTFNPHGFDEDRYWPLATESDLADVDSRAPVRVARDNEWHRIAERTFRVDAQLAAASVENPTSQTARVQFAMLVEAHREGRIELTLDGRALAARYAHPRFDARVHPRNYPPPNLVLAARIELAPGRHLLCLRVDNSHAEVPRGWLVVTDLTGLSHADARRLFDQRNLVANVGDTRENIELARSLFVHPFPRETSYAGEIFDGGGYAISNLPFPYYPYALALLACGNRVMSLGWLHVAMLIGIWAVVRRIARGQAKSPSYVVDALCLVSVLAYATLMRFMIESIYIHTTLTLVVLVCAHFFMRGDRALFLLYAAFAVLTKGGAVLVGMLLFAAFVIGPRPRGDTLRVAALFAGMCAALAAGLLCFGWATGSLGAWRSDFFGDDYTERFSLLLRSVHGDATALRVLAWAGGELSLRVLAAGGWLAALCLLGCGGWGATLALTGLAFHLLVCASDPGFESWGHSVHPLNYFTPAAPLLAAAGLRALHMRCEMRWGKRLAAALLIPALAGAWWCQVRAGTYRLSPDMEPAWRSMHAACVNDYLLRRGEARLKLKARLGAAHDARLALANCESHKSDSRLRYQKAKAHCLLAFAAQANGDKSEARAQLKAMLDASPQFKDIYEQCMSALERADH